MCVSCPSGSFVLSSTVVGPPTDVIKKMGDKVLARHIARTCNIPIVPGTDTPLEGIQEAYDFIAMFVPSDP
jgi:pyruvate carboxylase